MQRMLLREAKKFVQKSHRRCNWRKFVRVVAGFVVFCTTYALILPAITMERNRCQMEVHTHSESCYEKITPETVLTLSCNYTSLGVHSHTDDCFDAEGILACEEVDFVVHQHDAACLDETGTLVCELPVIEKHVHTDACYEAAETEPAVTLHFHGEGCYAPQRGELTCKLEESEGHAHGDACYTKGQLRCQTTEGADHTHSIDCYEHEFHCELPEEEGHIHGDGCYEQISQLICQLEEGTPEETGSCYEPYLDEQNNEQRRLICSEPMVLEHSHGESCFVAETVGEEDPNALTCLILANHVHGEGCYDETETLICEAAENHTHTDLCYGTWVQICGKEEHTHDLSCQNDPQADLETAEVWEATFADVTMTGDWGVDILSIARSQLGYEESTRNYEVLEDGESIRGYTRYGEWYGIPYGDWCAMFASFCIHYAGVEDMPLDSACSDWILTLEENDLYKTPGDYIPTAGDLIFFDWDADGESDHVGIVEQFAFATETESAKIITIEGNTADCVARREYAPDDATILGYGILPTKLSEEDKARIEEVILLIEPLPGYDDIMAKLDEFYEAEDTEGEEAYLTEVYAQVETAYRAYMALEEPLREKVTNADKLLELEFIWSRITLEEPEVYNYTALPHAAENTRIYLFDYGPLINTKITGQGMGYLPFYRVFPEYSYTVDGAARHDYDRTVNGTTVKADSAAPILKNTLQTNRGGEGYPYVDDGISGYLTDTTANGSWLTQYGSLQYLFDPAYSDVSKDEWQANIRANSRASFTYIPYANIGLTNINQKPLEDSNAGAANSAYLFRSAYLPVQNDGTGTGLFQRDDEGYWYYDSGQNAAWYNPDEEKFEVYDYTLIPGNEAFDNFGGTTNGNFLPFNLGHEEGLTDYQTKEGYVQYSNGNVRWDHRVTASVGDTVDGYPLLRENFRLLTQNRTNSVNLSFGMVVEFEFYMPKDGKINGEDMEFIFKGDDDVWVFIDNVLVLDIGGCHGAASASINFATGALTQPDSPVGYHKPYSLKNAFSNTGANTATFEGETFGDYTVHTLRFFYMERGGNISFCRLKFNMPQIQTDTLNVTKALEPDQKVDLLGNPDYYFTVMAMDANNQTTKLFIGPESASVTGITNYKVKNSDGSYVTNEDGTIKIFTVDRYGIFTLKAGQTAVFEDIPENAGRFYVQELIKQEDKDQYPGFLINNGNPLWQGTVDWSSRTYFPGSGTVGPYGYTWYGVSSQVTNANASSVFYFEQQNNVVTSNLASLSITKTLNAYNTASAGLRYKINVELDGEPLPANTTYKVGRETRTVGIDMAGNSYVELAGGETAVISNILSGSQFRVWEAEESAKGHTVTYRNLSTSGNGENVAVGSSGITGTVRVRDHVQLRVTNTQHGTQLSIPVTKRFNSFAGTSYSYDFVLTEMFLQSDGSWSAGETLATKNVTFTNANATTFTLASFTWLKHELDSLPATRYYMIEETGEEFPTVDNTTQYLVEVTISENTSTGGISAQITNILQRTSAEEEWVDAGATNVTYVNTLVSSLKVTKTVTGTTIEMPTTPFSFTLELSQGKSGMAPGSFVAEKTSQNGTVTQETVAAATYNFTLKHGESIVFKDVPIGTQWRITEAAEPGFSQSWTVDGTTGTTSDTGGNIKLSETVVDYVNSTGYELPHTGGIGIFPYTTAGLLLLLVAVTLLYKKSLRYRRGDTPSS